MNLKRTCMFFHTRNIELGKLDTTSDYLVYSHPLETLYYSLHLKLVHETQKVSFTGHDFSFAAQQRIIDVSASLQKCTRIYVSIIEKSSFMRLKAIQPWHYGFCDVSHAQSAA